MRRKLYLFLLVALLSVPLTWWIVGKTRFGLRLRAVGEMPLAVDSAGISVSWLRYRAVLLCGLFAGLAGAYLAIAQNAGFSRDMTAGQQTLSNFDGPRAHADEARRHYDLLSDSLKKDKLEAGATVDYAAWAAARKLGERGRSAVDTLFDDIDVILTAPAAGEAPVGLQSTGRAAFNLLWTYLWMPCIALPLTKGPTGLPVGIQLVGRQHEDARLLDIAAWARGALS